MIYNIGNCMTNLLVALGSKEKIVSKRALEIVNRLYLANWELERLDDVYIVKAWVPKEDVGMASRLLGIAFEETEHENIR